MPADAGFDLAIGNEYYAGGWVGCSVSFRAKHPSSLDRMRIGVDRGKARGNKTPISAPFSPLAAASLSPPMGATAPRASTRRLGAREQ